MKRLAPTELLEAETDMADPYLTAGLWGVLATPFTPDAGSVDSLSLRREVEHLVDCRAAGLVVLGVMGEAAQLTRDERLGVIRVVRETAPRIPLVIGLTELATPRAIESAVRAIEVAAPSEAALMVQVQSPEAQDLAEHLGSIHDATGARIVVQDYPLISGVNITPQALLEAVKSVGCVAAIKSEAPPTSLAVSILAPNTAAPVFGGLGGVGLLDELAAGAAGVMTGFSFPEALVATLRAWESGGFPAARETFVPWMPLVNFEGQAGIGQAIRKEIWRQRGIFASGSVRSPTRSLPAELASMLQQQLAHIPSGSLTAGGK